MKSKAVMLMWFAMLGFMSCQKSNQEADVPTVTADCINTPAACQSGVYQQSPGFSNYNGYNNNPYQNYGSPYSNNYGNSSNIFMYQNNYAYLCNCPQGMMPTYNNYSGLGCVQNTHVYGFGYSYFSWGSNNQWTNTSQVNQISGYSSSVCFNGVVQSCLTNQPNSCAQNYSCRPTTSSSQLGLCVSIYQSSPYNTYNTGPNGSRR